MKRTREHTQNNEPNAKRQNTTFEGLYDLGNRLYEIGQNTLAAVQNLVYSSASQNLSVEPLSDENNIVMTDKPLVNETVLIEEKINLVLTEHPTDSMEIESQNDFLTANTQVPIIDQNTMPELLQNKEMIDPELQAAIAYSLTGNEAIENKQVAIAILEENREDKKLPFGQQEKAQKMIAKLNLIWQTSSLWYEKLSDSDRIKKEKISEINQQIKICFDNLRKCIDEEKFQHFVLEIRVLALRGSEIFYDYGSMNLRYKKCENFLKEENLLDLLKAKMFTEYKETLSKYKTALCFLEKLQIHNAKAFEPIFWDDHGQPFRYIRKLVSMLERDLKKENLIELENNIVKNYMLIFSFKIKYSNLTKEFKNSLEMMEKLFDVTAACCKMGLTPELTQEIVLGAFNPEPHVLQFSYLHAQKMQIYMQNSPEKRTKFSFLNELT